MKMKKYSLRYILVLLTMCLLGSFAICLLYFVIAGGALDAEDFVRVTITTSRIELLRFLVLEEVVAAWAWPRCCDCKCEPIDQN